jgi:hypothetical protein
METIYSGRTDQNAEQIVRMGQNEAYLVIELEGFSKNDSVEIASIAINTFEGETCLAITSSSLVEIRNCL